MHILFLACQRGGNTIDEVRSVKRKRPGTLARLSGEMEESADGRVGLVTTTTKQQQQRQSTFSYTFHKMFSILYNSIYSYRPRHIYQGDFSNDAEHY